LTGKDTAGQYCLIDMHVPPGGGPPPHRDDFEESFTVLEGEIETNATHQFQNKSKQAARLLCLCSPAGQEELFLEMGVPVVTRTTPPPTPDPSAQEAMKAKVQALAPKYKTELLKEAGLRDRTVSAFEGEYGRARRLTEYWFGRGNKCDVTAYELHEQSHPAIVFASVRERRGCLR
jgi:hypothetical protein